MVADSLSPVTTDAPAPDFSAAKARQPCPCGSGRRFKACHGAALRRSTVAARPFVGLPSEPDWVALHEVVPSATAPLSVTGRAAPVGAAERDVLLVTLLPMAWPALVRSTGEVLLSLQTPGRSGDPSRDLAQALLAALAAEPGQGVSDLPAPEQDAPRLQDMLGPGDLDVSVYRGFDWWLGEESASGEAAAQLEQANAGVVPTARLHSVAGAYWCLMPPRAHLRWALPEDEDALLDALARLSAAGDLTLGEPTRYAGAFRADGLLVPVWDLPPEWTAEQCEEPAARIRARLDDALADSSSLTPEQRRARAGVVSRSVTL